MPTSTELRGQAEVPKIEPQIEFSVGIFSYERVKHLNFTVRRSGAILPRNPPRTFHQQLLFCSVATGYGPKSHHRSGQPPTLSPEVSDAAASAVHAPYTRLCTAEAAEA